MLSAGPAIQSNFLLELEGRSKELATDGLPKKSSDGGMIDGPSAREVDRQGLQVGGESIDSASDVAREPQLGELDWLKSERRSVGHLACMR